jgi:CheY-like chemotaxis protein
MLTAINSVLLIDDDPDEAFLMEEALRELGRPVRFHHIDNSEEVFTALALYRPQLVFMDVNMPRRNGIECLRRWRNQGILNKVPVIIYSSSDQDGLIQQAYAEGASLYLCKPPTFSVLTGSLAALLEKDWSDPSALRQRQVQNGCFRPFALA